MKAPSWARSRTTKWLLVLFTVIMTIGASLWPTQTTFAANLKIEWIELRIEEGCPPWPLSNSLKISGRTTLLRPTALQVSTGTHVTMERFGKGPLRIVLRADKDRSAGKVLDDTGKENALGTEAVLRVDDPERTLKENPVRFPIRAQIRLPQLSRFRSGESIPLLLGGTVQMIGRSLDRQSLFEAGKVELSQGDTILTADSPPPAVGILSLSDGPGLELICRFVADSVSIARFDSSGFALKVPFSARIINDKPLQLVWTCLGVVIGWLLKLLFPAEKENAT